MRLGYHYHIPALSRKEFVYTTGYQGVFIDSLAQLTGEVVCFLHRASPEQEEQMDYCIRGGNVRWVDLGFAGPVPRRLFKAGHSSSIVENAAQGLDACLLRGPSPLLPAIARRLSIPRAFLIVGSYDEGSERARLPWIKKQLNRIYADWYERQQWQALKPGLVLVNNRRLYDRYRPAVAQLHEVRTTTLSAGDFYQRSDTCQAAPYRLLFTGRMAYEKGILDIVEALAKLSAQGRPLVLDLVGWEDPKEPTLNQVMELAKQHGIAGRVRFHGQKAVGPELFAYYRAADIFIIASQYSFEGFPRTIWEALAHGLPVVATRVGSIPEIAGDCIRLAQPGDAVSLAQAVAALLDSPQLRRANLQRGYELVQENTLEVQTRRLVEHIERWVQVRHE